MSLNLQLQDDVSRAILDWGVAITYRVVERELNHQTQQVSETFVDISCFAIVETKINSQSPEVAGQGVNESLHLVVRQGDVPDDVPQLTDRVVVDGQEYVITTFECDSATGLLNLHVVRR